MYDVSSRRYWSGPRVAVIAFTTWRVMHRNCVEFSGMPALTTPSIYQ